MNLRELIPGFWTELSPSPPNNRAKRLLREAGHNVTRSAIRLEELHESSIAKNDLKTAKTIFSTTRQKDGIPVKKE